MFVICDKGQEHKLPCGGSRSDDNLFFHVHSCFEMALPLSARFFPGDAQKKSIQKLQESNLQRETAFYLSLTAATGPFHSHRADFDLGSRLGSQWGLAASGVSEVRETYVGPFVSRRQGVQNPFLTCLGKAQRTLQFCVHGHLSCSKDAGFDS